MKGMESTQAKAGRDSQVNTQFADLTGSIIESAQALVELRQRLDPVLRESVPEPTSDEVKEHVQLVPLAKSMKENNFLVKEHISIINDILHRLEL